MEIEKINQGYLNLTLKISKHFKEKVVQINDNKILKKVFRAISRKSGKIWNMSYLLI